MPATTSDGRLLFALDEGDEYEPYDVPKLTLWKRSKLGRAHTFHAYIRLDQLADKLGAAELEAIIFPWSPPKGASPAWLPGPLNHREGGHTPGPWQRKYSTRTGILAAIFVGQHYLGEMTREEDAILVEAAPRMLKALEAADGLLEEAEAYPRVTRVRNDISAAIAKAKGA